MFPEIKFKAPWAPLPAAPPLPCLRPLLRLPCYMYNVLPTRPCPLAKAHPSLVEADDKIVCYDLEIVSQTLVTLYFRGGFTLRLQQCHSALNLYTHPHTPRVQSARCRRSDLSPPPSNPPPPPRPIHYIMKTTARA